MTNFNINVHVPHKGLQNRLKQMPRKKAKSTLRSSNNMPGNLKHLDSATVVNQ